MSIGVLKSTNGGNTWHPTGLSFDRWDGEYVNRLLKDPYSDDIIYAATSEGVYKTTDAGVSFTLLAPNSFIDMEFHPSNPDIMYGSNKAGGTEKVFRYVN
jgi:hypothetical protein